MKKNLLFTIGLFSLMSNAQIYSNGGISTGTTSKSGVTAPVGTTWSEIQNNTGNTTEANTLAGSACTYNTATNFFYLADDFVVPAGTNSWQISTMEFFSYQTGYTGTTSPFGTIRVNIFNGDPSLSASTSVFGDNTTNRFASSTTTNTYRIFNSLYPAPGSTVGTTRMIWKTVANTPKTLNPGTYWVTFQLENVVQANAGFYVLATIPGTRGLPTNNAKQFVGTTSNWSSIIDLGAPTSAPDVPQDLAFVVNYTSVLGTNETMQFDNRIKIYPNPVSNEFRISNISETTKIASVEVLDMSGKLIKSLKPSDSYDISDLEKGTYLIYIKSNEVTKISKLIKN